MKEQIEVTIGPDGQATVHVKGVKGKACLLVTKALEDALGMAGERKMTSEYYEQPTTTTITQRGGR